MGLPHVRSHRSIQGGVVTKPVPNFTRLDPCRSEIAILMDAMLRAREVVAARSWATSQEPHRRASVGGCTGRPSGAGMILAVHVFNSPSCCFKTEIFSVLANSSISRPQRRSALQFRQA